MEGDAADALCWMRDTAQYLRLRDVAEVVNKHAKVSPAAVANSATVLHAYWHHRRTMQAGPCRLIAGKGILLVFVFFTQALSRNPPTRHLLDVGRIGHVDDE